MRVGHALTRRPYRAPGRRSRRPRSDRPASPSKRHTSPTLSHRGQFAVTAVAREALNGWFVSMIRPASLATRCQRGRSGTSGTCPEDRYEREPRVGPGCGQSSRVGPRAP
jgi:hypothetical protein